MTIDDLNPPLTQRALRVANAWRVLEIVRASGSISRTRVARKTGLTVPTVHRLIEGLLDDGLVIRSPAAASGAMGRPARLFSFNGRAGFVVGVDIGNETTRSALSDLAGVRLATTQGPTAEMDADIVGALERLARDLATKAAIDPAKILAVGIGVPAIVSGNDDIVRAALHRRWEGVPLASRLQERLAAQVVVAPDDYFAALGELRGGACRGVDDALVLNVGKGIGAGLIVGGSIYAGASDAAGRVGWARIPRDGSLVAAGDVITADGLIADYRRQGGRGAVTGARDVFAAAKDGDPAAADAVELFATRLGQLLATGAAFLDPEVVVIGGGIAGSFDSLEGALRAELAQTLARPPLVIASPLGIEAGVVGATAAALDRADAWLQEQIAA